MSKSLKPSLDLGALHARFASGELTPENLIADITARIIAHADPAIFICLVSSDDLARQLAEIEARKARGEKLPLYGVPFAVKDNIDLAGYPTTAACPDFAYTPTRSATVIEKLCAAGAIVIGKTNLDQFATGLVGTRSPYGTPRNPFNADYIPGGSSSGSAVAVSAGLVSFALGTDTAGSGRVPAAFNNLVGVKPTCGLISTHGVVPACRSLDCVSIFALTCADAAEVLAAAAGHDPADAYSRDPAAFESGMKPINPRKFRLGVPRADQQEFFGDREVGKLYHQAIERLKTLGAVVVEIDFSVFSETARLLYDGPWVAERLGGIQSFVDAHPQSILEVTRTIIGRGDSMTAIDAFKALHELQRLKAEARQIWTQIDLLCLPTAPTIYTRDQIQADPYQLNSDLGTYTNFVNLMDLSGLALPAGFCKTKLPAGLTLLGRAWRDDLLLEIGDAFQRSLNLPLGATGAAFPTDRTIVTSTPAHWIEIGVLGAHLSGLPLNHQLTDLGARLVRTAHTANCYRFYALPGTVPPKPGLVRVVDGQGGAIELEVWAMAAEEFGKFVASIPRPLGIGTISLDDGGSVKGFLCESVAVEGGRDITEYGGWRAFLAQNRG